MKLTSQDKIISLVQEEHLWKNDLFLRWLSIETEPEEVLQQLSFHLLHQEELLCSRTYAQGELLLRLEQGRAECLRYRQSSLPRILGLTGRPLSPLMDEYFLFYSSKPASALLVECRSNLETRRLRIPVVQHHSPNTYFFPMRGQFLVSDTYPSINSHRWCRNSEFAFDVGNADPRCSQFHDLPVYAAGAGRVVEVFDGLEDTDDATCPDEIERRFGEHARIDGNHVLIDHGNREVSLYAHLRKGSVAVQVGDTVTPDTLLGLTGSSGNSRVAHLHFHLMQDGIHGPGLPVEFQNLYTFFGQRCLLDEPTNLVYTK